MDSYAHALDTSVFSQGHVSAKNYGIRLVVLSRGILHCSPAVMGTKRKHEKTKEKVSYNPCIL